MLTRILTAKGYAAQSETWATSVMERLRRHRCEAILLDLRIQRAIELEHARRLAKREGRNRVCVAA